MENIQIVSRHAKKLFIFKFCWQFSIEYLYVWTDIFSPVVVEYWIRARFPPWAVLVMSSIRWLFLKSLKPQCRSVSVNNEKFIYLPCVHLSHRLSVDWLSDDCSRQSSSIVRLNLFSSNVFNSNSIFFAANSLEWSCFVIFFELFWN